MFNSDRDSLFFVADFMNAKLPSNECLRSTAKGMIQPEFGRSAANERVNPLQQVSLHVKQERHCVVWEKYCYIKTRKNTSLRESMNDVC